MASYQVEVDSRARKEIRQLPGHIRAQVLRVLRMMEQEPRLPHSRPLDLLRTGIHLDPGVELRRLRIASWRIVYLVDEGSRLVTVLAIRQRPPYQYDDLEELLRSN